MGRTTAAPPSSETRLANIATESLRSTFYTQQQLCKELPGVTLRKLSYWRANRIGPKWSRIGREIIYFRDSVESYLHANEINIEPEPTRKPRRGAR